jgi:hypothetical protein
MKMNLALSRLMKDACSSAQEASCDARQVLRPMGYARLNGQEIFVQHAVYVCTGLPLRGLSRDTVFVPHAPPTDCPFL